MDFYRSLNYSFGNEDWRVEKKALQVAPKDQALCVTASGDRPLHLLLTDADRVVSIDVNQSQTFLLELKMAVYSQFDYEKALCFLGCSPSAHRLSLFQELTQHISEGAKQFWENNLRKINKGIIYQGKTEQLCALAARFIGLFRGKAIKQLFSFTNIDEQKKFVDEKWDSWSFRKTFAVAVHPAVFKFLSNDPGVTGFTEYVKHPGLYIYERMLSYLRNYLANESALLQLIFLGNVTPKAYLPYLTPQGFDTIRTRLHKLEYKTGNIVEYLLASPKNTFNCFSMSDIASYMPQNAFENLVEGMYQSAAPNARFCIRELISKRYFPQELAPYFQRNATLESELEKEESNFVYRFMAGIITK